MRNLTVKRAKSFVGCLAKIKIYIEDSSASEITINSTPCRKIGELKNGEEKTFSIGDQALKVFAIADTASKSFCFDYVELGEGEQDIFLSGKNLFNPATGNAFIFDNNVNEKIIAEHKKSKRRGIIIFIACAIIGAIIGVLRSGVLFDNTPQPKVFSFNEMSITLTDEFVESKFENNDFVYDSKNVAVFGLRESFDLAEGFGDNTIEEYGNLVMKNNGHTSSELKTLDELVYYDYDFTNPQTNDTYRYFTYMYKSDDAFWVIQFATSIDNVDTYAPKITDWAKSVEFSK